MKKTFILACILILGLSLHASETNNTMTKEDNTTITGREDNSTIVNQELQKALELEAKYAKEQKFYDAESYDFKAAEVNKDSLDTVPLIVPDPTMDTSHFLEMPN
ncbi:MAG: hypothetical protein HF962_08455 [Sulfurovum sp.]|nr:hypothetical protein [Sulfurovum sp.]